MHPAYVGELPEGWQGGAPVTKYWNGNFIHLYRVTRAWVTCRRRDQHRRDQACARR